MIIDDPSTSYGTDKVTVTMTPDEARVMAHMLAHTSDRAIEKLPEADHDIAIDFADPFRRFL